MSGNQWNIAHVLNCLSAGIPIPPDRYGATKSLIEAYVSDAIAKDRYHEMVLAVHRMHRRVDVALEDNDILRAKTLIVDWELEYGYD